MGYLATSLACIRFHDCFDFYVFVVGDTLWKGGVLEIIHRNFEHLSREVGEANLVIRGFPGQ